MRRAGAGGTNTSRARRALEPTLLPGAGDVIRDNVRKWFEQALVETVLGAQSLKNSPQWAMDDIAQLWSEEALTAAVLQRYHIDIALRRALGTKLGSLKESVA